MTDRVQVVAVVVSLILLATVVELVRRRKLIEEYSIVWIICAVAMLALAIWRDLLDAAARRLGIFYPQSLLLMFVTGLVFVALLWFSVILSRQRRQIDRLMEESAVLAAEIRELREERGGASAPQEHVR